MRVAALYDIHGNVHALEAVLGELAGESPDLIVVGGDVANGPFPVATIDRLKTLEQPTRFVMGNGDRSLLVSEADDGEPDAWAEATRWCAEQIGDARRALLAGFEPTVELDAGDLGPVLFCHGSPRSDEEIITPASPETRVAPMLEGITAPTVVCGHTHMQFDRRVAGKRLVNAGSVGMPYSDVPGAYWALLGEEIELRRTSYDLEEAAAASRATGWPLAEEFAAENVLTVPTAAAATAIFEPEPDWAPQ